MANNISFGGGNGGGGSSTLSGLSDVTLTTPTSGQVLKYDGSKWVNGTGGGSSGHDYSTTEQVVGTWVDGSTIYEKTIAVTQGGSETTYPAPANIDKIWFDQNASFMVSTSNGDTVSLGYYNGTNSDRFQAYYNANTRNICVRSSWSGSGYITIRYTKTSI